MRIDRFSLLLGAAIGLGFAGSVAALEGKVVDSTGEPVVGARVCYAVERAELLCSATGDDGAFELPDSKMDTLRVVADDFLPIELGAASVVGPIVIRRAPTLVVRLVNAENGEPIADGAVSVVYSTGKVRGPFPVNASGVRVRRLLTPGEVRILAEAAGYRQPGATHVELESGEQTEVTIELRPE